jgi:hypothetical protein
MRERRVGVAATMRGVARVMAGFGRLRVQIMILALLLTLRLILFDFHLLSKFGVLEPPPPPLNRTPNQVSLSLIHLAPNQNLAPQMQQPCAPRFCSQCSAFYAPLARIQN